MVTSEEWNGRTGRSWAEEWRRTDRTFGPLTEHLLARSRGFSFTGALDIGCGAGELSMALARGRPRVRVIGVDISPQLVEVAEERGSYLPNVAFELADASQWAPAQGFVPDLLVSRHGVMFFEDPRTAFAHLASIAAPEAGLLFSCFRDRADNPFFVEAMRLLPGPQPDPDPVAPGPFAFADADRVQALLGAAGWRDIAFEPFDFAMVTGAGADPIADAVEYFLRIGPAARAARDLDEAERERLIERLSVLAERNLYERLVSLRAGAWVVTARNA